MQNIKFFLLNLCGVVFLFSFLSVNVVEASPSQLSCGQTGLSKNGSSVTLNVGADTSAGNSIGVDVDWDDGNVSSDGVALYFGNWTFNHTYSASGNYSIHIHCTDFGSSPDIDIYTPVTIANPAVNGSCGQTHYNCNSGTSTNQNNGANSYTWTCAGSGGGSSASCSEAKATPTVTISANPSSITSGNRVDLTWSSTNVTDCYASGGWSGGQPTSGTTPVYPTSDTTYRIDCSSVASGSTWAQTTVSVSAQAGMSGTLTPSSQGCTLASGATTCNATLSWTTTNPVGTSAVTNNGGATPASSSGNSGTNVTFAVPYYAAMNGVTTFYLYNNEQLLKMATVTVCNTATPWNGATCGTNNYPAGAHDYANCTDAGGWAIDWDSANDPVRIQIFDGIAGGSKVAVGDFYASLLRSDLNTGSYSQNHGFVWPIPESLKDNVAHTLYAYALDLQDSSHSTLLSSNHTITCAPSPMSGTLTAPSCSIPLNGSTCDTTVTWSVTNPEASPTQVTSSTPADGTVIGSGTSGTAVVALPYGGQTFYLYNNAKSLVPTSPNGSGVFANANCVSGSNWNGTKCSSSYPALSVDLKLNSGTGFTTSGDYATTDKALSVLLGEALRLSWNASGSPSLNCVPKDGSSGDGWDTGLAVSNVGSQNVTAPDTIGQIKYTLDCTQGGSTVTDQNWINVGIVKVSDKHIIWSCPPPSTESIGVNFSTDLNGDGKGDLSGDVVVSPTVTTDYAVKCNNGSEGSVKIVVPKKPIFKEN